MDPKQLRSIIREEVTGIVKTELKPVKEDLKILQKDVKSIQGTLADHSKRLTRVEDKVDALSGDIEQLHDDVKGIRDKEGMYHSRNKREIDEIKTHLGMPLISDIPEV